MTSPPTPPRRELVSAAETGRVCPYCRFPLKQGIELTRCGVCSAPHHGDCWSDNGGCAVVACAGGPSGAAGQAGAPAPAQTPATRVMPPAPAPAAYAAAHAPTPPPPADPPPAWTPPRPADPPPAWTPPSAAPAPAAGRSGGGRSGPWLVAGAVIVALALAGAAFAVVLAGKSGSQATRTVISVQPASAGAGGRDGAGATAATDPVTDTTPTAPAGAGSASGYPPADETAREQIEQVLLEHHQDLVDGDFRGAWDLMSKRKQAQKLREEGFATWAADQQKLLTPYLVPSGLHVEFAAYDRSTGVARVMVTGMGWTKQPDKCGGRYEGLTWVKYEDGAWRYDPGYSTTPERERLWSTRPQPYDQLLGTRCE